MYDQDWINDGYGQKTKLKSWRHCPWCNNRMLKTNLKSHMQKRCQFKPSMEGGWRFHEEDKRRYGFMSCLKCRTVLHRNHQHRHWNRCGILKDLLKQSEGS